MESKKQIKINNFNSQRGFVALLVSILILVTMISISVSISALIIGRHKISANILKSTQAYFAAEAGIEDALLRLDVDKDMNWTSTSTLKVGQATSTIQISDMIGGARNITSEGNFRNIIRRVRVVYQISAEQASFYYGAQIGDGGVVMKNGSTIYGNVFSNGSIEAEANTEITGTVKVAQTGNYINGVTVGKDAFVYNCLYSNISGKLKCATSTECTFSSQETLIDEIATGTMPFSQEQIKKWTDDALLGGVTSTVILKEQDEIFLGPKKIEGNLIVQDRAKLFITGTIWVTGTITAANTAEIRLDEASYGSLSGIIISDDIITLQDKGKALGTGKPGSYLLLISTASGESAITIKNKFRADILYTQNGWIVVQDTADMREVTGYGIHLENKAEIIYEVGLQDTAFSSGPGGSWGIISWSEIE